MSRPCPALALAAAGSPYTLRRLAAALAVIAAAACADSPAGPPDGISLEITAGNAQLAPAGAAVAIDPAVRVTDGAGQPRRDVSVTFEVVAGGGWTYTPAVKTDLNGRASAWWLLGPDPAAPQRLRASAAGQVVEFTAIPIIPPAASFQTGRNAYIEYLAGNLPVIITAPHGGSLRPTEIPDRTVGTTARDTNTEELVRTLRQAFLDRTGGYPHLVINRLHRIKLDANREIVEAAQGDANAERAWFEFHAFIETAKLAAADAGLDDAALYLDLHGHGHPIPRIEIGYLLGSADLALPDAALGQSAVIARSSIRALAQNSGPRFIELIRGATSLGGMLELSGYPAVPSATQASPGNDPYFTGGYNTERHGSRDGGTVNGVQLELNFDGIRDTEADREQFADSLAAVVDRYFQQHMGGALRPPPAAAHVHRRPPRAAVPR